MGIFRFRVRTRIYLGYAILIALTLGIAVFGTFELSGVGRNVGKMDALAGNTQRSLQVARHLTMIGLAQSRYLADPSDAVLQTARQSADSADSLLTEAQHATLSPQRLEIYRAVQDGLRTLRADLNRFGELGMAWSAQRALLFTGGDTLTAAAGRLVQAARATHDPALSAAASDVEASTLLVRVANWRFMATLDKKGPATFKTNAAHARDALATMQRIAKPEIAALVAPVQAALSNYETAFNAFSSARLASETFYNEQTRPQLEAMQQKLQGALDSLAHDFAASRTTAADTVSSASWLQEIVGILALALGATLAFVIGRGIVRPLTEMTGVMGKLAAGDNGVAVPAQDSQDEIGDMARAVGVFKQHAIDAERLAAEQATARAAKERRQAAMEQYTQDFGKSVSGVMASLAASADTMRSAADAMAEAATAVHTEAHGTSGDAAKSSADLMTVASAVEELTSSVAEISRQVTSSADVARQAVQRADASKGTMQSLSEATARIGDVVRLISDIAAQTNLLALNATIEAARAGEAGKGFAVVAGEVKALAAQTAKATAEIGSQIDTVRSATTDAVSAMTEIGTIIGKMDQVSAAISAAVEQQNATTREIAGNVQAVSGATSSTAQAMEHVVTVADRAGDISRDVLTGAAEISREAETLRTEVDQFLAAVREDTTEERRRYERLTLSGVSASLQAKGKPAAQVALRNMSRGGAALACDWNLPAGAQVEIDMPAAGGLIPARVVRSGGGELAVVFSSDPQILARIDRALGQLTETKRAA
ncbi:MAG TPA: methyl-accepting chemotaxis protein [Acetobacteraceae bacterium]|nr:methyl-accepting chemotaxis protein [Acetobacteraceae bacterium]